MEHHGRFLTVPCLPLSSLYPLQHSAFARVGDIEVDNCNKWISRDVSLTTRFPLIISLRKRDFRFPALRMVNTFNFDPACKPLDVPTGTSGLSLSLIPDTKCLELFPPT